MRLLFGENHSIPQLSFRSRSASLFLAGCSRRGGRFQRIFGDASRAPPIRLPVSQGYRDIGVGIAFGLTPSARSVAPPGLADSASWHPALTRWANGFRAPALA